MAEADDSRDGTDRPISQRPKADSQPGGQGAGSDYLRPRSARSIAICLAALAVLTVADLWSKQWALETLSQPKAASLTPPVCAADQDGRRGMQRQPVYARVLIEGHLQLSYAENCGAAFGVLNSAPRWIRASIFSIAAVAAIGVLLWMYIRGSGGLMFALAVPMITSGALGNLVDRLRYGYVIDFIRYHGLFEWPTFNVADATITVGVVFLFLDGIGASQQTGSTEPRTEVAET
jgi:signal peptidase II